MSTRKKIKLSSFIVYNSKRQLLLKRRFRIQPNAASSSSLEEFKS